MKTLLITLIACTFMGATLSYAADDRAARKDATTWVKTSMTQKKKLLAAAKKVKNVKTAEKFAKDVDKIYEELKVDGTQTAMGSSAPAEAPTGDAVDAEMEKKAKALEKLDEALDKELNRIEEAEIDSSELNEALKKVKKINDLLG